MRQPSWHHMRGRSLGICRKKHAPLIAPFVDQLKRRITVTHPFHPKYGQEFELVDYHRSWGKECVKCYDHEGRLVTIPLQFTDAKGVKDPFLEASAGRSYFRVEDLLQLAELIKRLRT